MTANHSTHRLSILRAAALVALGYWLMDSWLHSTLAANPFSLIPADGGDLSMRLVVVGVIIGLGLYSRQIARRESEEASRLEALVEGGFDGVVLLDERRNVTYFNRQAASLLGVAGEPVGHPFEEVVPGFTPLFPEIDCKAGACARCPGPKRIKRHYAPGNRHLEVQCASFRGGAAIYLRDVTEEYQRGLALEESNKRLEAILGGAGDGIVTISQRGVVETFNPSAEKIFGYSAAEVIGWDVAMLMPEEHAVCHQGYVDNYISTGISRIINIGPREVVAKRKDGTLFNMDLAVGEMELDGARYFVGIVRDITERIKAREALRQSEENLSRAQAIAHLGSWSWNIASGAIAWSDEVFRIFGHTPGAFEPTYEKFLNQVHPDDRDLLTSAVGAALEGDLVYELEHRLVRPNGDWRVVVEQGEVTRDANGAPLSMVGIVQDVTERKRAQEAIEFMSNFDGLTGLPNRALMLYRLEQALSQAHREQQMVGLLIIDIARFKVVNDTLGYAAGDRLLKNVAERLTASVREGDTVARLGGDEFAIVLAGLAGADEAAQQAQRIIDDFRDPVVLDETEWFVVAHIGITIFPHDGDGAEALVRNADAALHRAKAESSDNYQFFTADMTVESRARLELERDLRRAIERREFVLFYQPQVELASGEVIGVEALIRWRHPERGLVSPALFVPLLEETGLILQIGQWVLREACRQNRDWQAARLPPLRVAVNLSALQFKQQDLVEQVAAALAESGLHAQWLELEITEGLLVENVEETTATLHRLNAMGVKLSIDDFGTGYSSLNYLQRFPVHTLKIDRSFISEVERGEDGMAIPRAVIALAHTLNLKVIAEGVESERQLEFLLREQCDEVQGYYYSPPLPAEKLPAWLLKQRGRSAGAM